MDIRPGEVVAVTGVSGSGKSSLAVDTLYAEGQRRFVESFSPYARQFLERLERPPMNSLEPVPAGIAVDRRAPVKSSRSTVATMADLAPYLAALFARESVPLCPDCGVEATRVGPLDAADRALELAEGLGGVLSYPVRLDSETDADGYLLVREDLARDGFRRLLVDGVLHDIDRIRPSSVLKEKDGVIDVVVDRLMPNGSEAGRVAASIEEAWRRGAQLAHLTVAGIRHRLRAGLACPECALPFEQPYPGLFSHESPLGACPTCRGFGRTIGVDLEKVIPDPSKSLGKGAIRPWSGRATSWERAELAKLCRRHGIPLTRPWRSLDENQQHIVLHGDGSWHSGRFPGVVGWFKWLETRTYKMHVRVFLARYRSYERCPECQGRRLNEHALRYRVGGRDLAEWNELEVGAAKNLMDRLETRTGQGELARSELASRLTYLDRVGLGYLTLSRQARTLSGGEAQRVTLTAALGTSLHNALFVLDEPTVGLHATDVEPLCEMMRELADRGSAVLVVEHDARVISRADRVIEMGPGAGRRGGRLVADGSPSEVAATGGATTRALSSAALRVGEIRPARQYLRVRGARAHNLKNITVDIPLGVLCAVTGPSGSGKSTLAVDVVHNALARRLGDFDVDPAGAHDGIDDASGIGRVSLVDQSPLGRTSRGNAATYTKAWQPIRKLYASEPAAVANGLSARHFSFNVDGGRCDACSGEGWETIEMQFLADVRLVCPVCKGKKFKPEVLRVDYRGTTVAQLLESTVDEALRLFEDQLAVVRALGPVARLGLGYLRLGQPLTTLSGGEAQRLKLGRALAENHDNALLVLDEPSAGLHVDEVRMLLDALALIVSAGGSVLVVEHDLDIVRAADYVIDLGPGGGAEGGEVVAVGTPAEIACGGGRTGAALRADRRSIHASLRASSPAPRAANRTGDGAVLSVTRAREHNLLDLSVTIPHGALTVVTGPSGSGKSTLAFDVVFAEGQRRFLETLTPYARQFLPTMPRPDVDAVRGVPPSIALEQRSTRAGPKSTVATITEVAHYLRLLYAKLGVIHCPRHDEPIGAASADQVFRTLRRRKGTFDLLAPVVRGRKGTYLDVFSAAARDGIELAWCDGDLVSTDRPPKLARSREHTIDLVLASGCRSVNVRKDAFDRALRWGQGAVKLRASNGRVTLLSTSSTCPACRTSVPELDPRWFSFNTAQGRCASCNGDGVVEPRPSRHRRRGAVGAPPVTCRACGGSRLSPIPRHVRLRGERYHEFVGRSVSSAARRVAQWRFTGDRRSIAKPVVAELQRRLQFLRDVGLDYLALDRPAATLSGGEMQRLRLAAQLGAGLTGALYILDEPTIGLHPTDTARLLRNLRDLVALGSSVIVVEHDVDTIRAADHVVDLGPGGGAHGGRVVAAGPPSVVLGRSESPTARALADPPELRRHLPTGRSVPRLSLFGARRNNLRAVDIQLPLGRFNVVAGVSGSGKSTLVRQVLLPALRARLGLATEPAGAHRGLTGFEHVRRAVSVDQSPIGRTPRSVPATFLGIFDHIRRLYAATPDAQVAGFGPSRFSFNTSAGGRCATCEGQGVITHEMSFLPDVATTCPACSGRRFEPRTLDVRYLGLSIGEVLELTAERASEVFRSHPKVSGPLQTLTDLGAGYVTLGQGSHTLSGGEAQRLKLAAELTARARHEPTLYVLDEPTTGLHLADVSKLMTVLDRLVNRGDTLVVIEHHPVVIAGADWMIELGPGGGKRGGRVIAKGPPRLISTRKTPTARILRDIMRPRPAPPPFQRRNRSSSIQMRS